MEYKYCSIKNGKGDLNRFMSSTLFISESHYGTSKKLADVVALILG